MNITIFIFANTENRENQNNDSRQYKQEVREVIATDRIVVDEIYGTTIEL